MRILQLMFAISAFATTVNYTGFIDFMCDVPYKFSFEYPFNLLLNQELNLGAKNNCTPRVKISSDFSSDAKFFVASGVIAMLYCLFIMIVYTKFDNKYRTDNRLPVFDFFMTVFIAVLWVSSSASWANALANMKYISHDDYIQWDNLGICTRCPISVSSFSSLNVSVILGFLKLLLMGYRFMVPLQRDHLVPSWPNFHIWRDINFLYEIYLSRCLETDIT